MLKNIGGALLGYIAMFALVFVGMSAAWMILGADGAYEPGTWDVSAIWNGVMLLVGLAAAVAGGLVCARVSPDRTGVYILVGIILVMAVLSAMPDGGDVVPTTRPDGISMWDAMVNARPAAWVRWANPIIGIVGVLVGASKVKAT